MQMVACIMSVLVTVLVEEAPLRDIKQARQQLWSSSDTVQRHEMDLLCHVTTAGIQQMEVAEFFAGKQNIIVQNARPIYVSYLVFNSSMKPWRARVRSHNIDNSLIDQTRNIIKWHKFTYYV